MPSIKLLIFSVILTLVQTKPTTESTHEILKRLGFDQINKPIVNHHSKRVASETNKARYHNDVYNSDTDSKLFVVKLPPHHPYYAHTKPEKFENEVITKPPMSFRTNGQPARVYHWNIPIIKKVSQPKPHKSQYRKLHEDSKIYHLKILPNQEKQDADAHKKYKKYNKHAYKDRLDKIKQSKYHKNHVKYYKFNDVEKSDNHILSIKELAENGMEHIKIMKEFEKEMHQNDRPMVTEHKTKKHNSKDKYANEVMNEKNKKNSPVYYSPAIPKQNSFYKYFPGNGKPKSFYVIEKSEKPTRYHRLL